MKKGKENKKQTLIQTEEEFEINLFHALKSFGYLFPKNNFDVDNFEKHTSKSEGDISDQVFANIKETNLKMKNHQGADLSLEIAALKPKRNDFDHVPNDKPKKISKKGKKN